jgi:hypothetical protein
MGIVQKRLKAGRCTVGIEAGQDLVRDQHGRIPEQSADESQPVALTA